MNAPTEKLAADVKVIAADVEELVRATAAETGDRLYAARNRVQAALGWCPRYGSRSGQGRGGDNGPLRAGKHVDRGVRIVRDRLLRRPAGRAPLAGSVYATKRSTETPKRGKTRNSSAA